MNSPTLLIFGGENSDEIEVTYQYKILEDSDHVVELSESATTKGGHKFIFDSYFSLRYRNFQIEVYENGERSLLLTGDYSENSQNPIILMFTSELGPRYQLHFGFIEYDIYDNQL